jgi:hypothetical protein
LGDYQIELQSVRVEIELQPEAQVRQVDGGDVAEMAHPQPRRLPAHQRRGGVDVTKNVQLTVLLAPAELAALSHVAVVVTSAADTGVIYAAEAGLRSIRQAAAGHPARLAHLRRERRHG